jgi:hypothetical protein
MDENIDEWQEWQTLGEMYKLAVKSLDGMRNSPSKILSESVRRRMTVFPLSELRSLGTRMIDISEKEFPDKELELRKMFIMDEVLRVQ